MRERGGEGGITITVKGRERERGETGIITGKGGEGEREGEGILCQYYNHRK